MKIVILILLSFFMISNTPIYSQTDAEIMELMQKLEALKKKKAIEDKKIEKNKSVAKTAKQIKEDTPEIAAPETEDDKLAKIEADRIKRQNTLDSLSQFNSFELDSAAKALLHKKRPTTILVNNTGADSVFLEVDDVAKGKVRMPYLVEGLLEGWHKVYVKNDWGFVDYKESIFKADTLYKLEFKAGIPKSYISINSSPQQVQISLNDSAVGLSPIKIENLKPGKYKISMKTNGFSSYETEVELNGLFNPEIYAELNEEIPESYRPVYSQPEKIAGAVLGTTALITGIMGLVKHSTATGYFDDAAASKAKADAYLKDGDKTNAGLETEKEIEYNALGSDKRDTANLLLMISFIGVSFSVPLLTF